MRNITAFNLNISPARQALLVSLLCRLGSTGTGWRDCHGQGPTARGQELSPAVPPPLAPGHNVCLEVNISHHLKYIPGRYLNSIIKHKLTGEVSSATLQVPHEENVWKTPGSIKILSLYKVSSDLENACSLFSFFNRFCSHHCSFL